LIEVGEADGPVAHDLSSADARLLANSPSAQSSALAAKNHSAHFIAEALDFL